MLRTSQPSLGCTVLWSRKNCRGEKDVLSVMQSAFCFHGHTKEMMQIKGIVSFKVSLPVTQALIFLFHENSNGELFSIFISFKDFYCMTHEVVNWLLQLINQPTKITSAPPLPPPHTCTPHPFLCSVFITLCLFLSLSLCPAYVSLSLSFSLSFLSVPLSLTVCGCLSGCVYVSLSLSLSQPLSVYTPSSWSVSQCMLHKWTRTPGRSKSK